MSIIYLFGGRSQRHLHSYKRERERERAERYRETDIGRERGTGIEKDIQTDIGREGGTGLEKDRQTDRQINRNRVRQADRHGEGGEARQT